MKKYAFFTLSILLLAAEFCGSALRAQTLSGAALHAYRLRQIRETFAEKMHGEEIPTGTKAGSEFSPLITPNSNYKISTGDPESEVHAAVNPTDTTNIVIGAMNDSPTAGLTFPVYFTKNFGSSWAKSSFTPDPYQAGALIAGGGDPVFAYDANGTLYMSWIDLYELSGNDTIFAGMYWASSTNGGQTWQRATNGYIGKGFELFTSVDTNSGIDDKEWIAVDRSNSVYRNTLYVAWTHLGYSHYGVMVRRKLPGVDSMEAPVQVSSPKLLFVQYTSIGVDAKGGIHVTFLGSLDTLNYSLYEAYSSDGGKTFQPEVKISDVDIPNVSQDAQGDPIFGIRLNGNYPCAHLSIDTAGEAGNLYEVWCALGTDSNEGLGDNIYFSRSIDNGSSWSTPTIINNDVDTESNYIDHFYPSIAVNGKGKISVGWYDRREDPNNEIGRYYIGQSTDQGNTWMNMPVASKPMDFSDVMDVNQNFGIGEYTQVIATPNYTIPVWTDGRDDAGALRIYAEFLANAAAGVQQISSISEGVSLAANYPNPFSASTHISFTVAEPTHAALYITNVAGARVGTLFDNQAETGEHDFTFDALNLADGVYYLNLETGLGVVRRAMTILR